MSRAITSRQVISATFTVAPFTGPFLASFGRPELRGAWIVYGGSGSGKTTFLLQLANYLSTFCRVAYNSIEQGLSLSLQRAWQRVGIAPDANICLLDRESPADIRRRLNARRAPQVVIIDSLQYWPRFSINDYIALRRACPATLFVFVAHAKGDQPKGAVAQTVRFDADIKIRVEGYKAFVTTRFETDTEGGSDYIIWPEGAQRYWQGL